jgi:hypothetical protein
MRLRSAAATLSVFILLTLPLFAVSADNGQAYPQPSSQHTRYPAGAPPVPPPLPAQYKLLAWSELGMHCIDGKDYSIFAVLPPYNIVHAQLIKMGEPPQRIATGVTITYEATADPTGSTPSVRPKPTSGVGSALCF